MIDKLFRLLRHNTVMTVAPPGKLKSNRDGAIIVLVPSIMRSGTHVLIDSILNNVWAYRRRPLYIDLDQFVINGLDPNDILLAGPYVVKTHFPQVQVPGLSEAVQLIAARSRILIPRRNRDSIIKSSLLFDADLSAESINAAFAQFDDFWSRYDHMDVQFARLIHRDQYQAVMSEISKFIGNATRKKLIFPPAKDEKMKVYIIKAMTRLIGKYSPVVNTTISFSKKNK